MTTKKRVSTKRKVSNEAPIFPLSLPPPIRTSQSSRSRNNIGIMLVWGASDEPEITKGRRNNRLPNPWPPDDIVTAVKIVCSTAGLAGIAYKTIKLWFDSRNAKKIRIKRGDFELEIHGSMSQTEIEKRITQFRRLTKEIDRDDIKIILPARVDRSIPSEQVEKKGSKK